jgi:hypothetical protein
MVRFERSADGLGPDDNEATFGPFEWVQLTYGSLRISPDGEDLAAMRDGAWHIEWHDSPYSDVVIYDKGAGA